MLKLKFEMMKIWFLSVLGQTLARSVNNKNHIRSSTMSETTATFEVETKRKVIYALFCAV